MAPNRHLILDATRIQRTLRRMAYEIWERTSSESAVTFVGVEKVGLAVAESLAEILREISDTAVAVLPLAINKKSPLATPASVNADLNGCTVVLVDDVANSGRTLFHAFRPLLAFELKALYVAVLVDRQHKTFPVAPDVTGLAVSTTIQEHIEVETDGATISAAYLH